jgi:hypothetical protein
MKRIVLIIAATSILGCISAREPQPIRAASPSAGQGSDVICEDAVPVGSMISRVTCRQRPIADPRDTDGIMSQMQHPNALPKASY